MKSRIIGNIKIEIDRELCIGAASCVTIAPNTFVLDDEGKVDLLEEEWDDIATIQSAADSCPVRAITITYLDSQADQVGEAQSSESSSQASTPPAAYTSSDMRTQMALDQLKTVLDPELGINVVDLGLVYDLNWQGDNLTATMTLTTPGCPLVNEFLQNARNALLQLPKVGKVVVDLTFDPPWSPVKMSPEAIDELGGLRF